MSSDALNLSGLSIDDKGKVFFSGLTSGIDFKTAIDGIIAAKRIPIDTLETRVSDNEAKIAALKDFRTLLSSFKNALADLRGAITVGSTDDVFAAKTAFASTLRTDGATPSTASNLLGVSVTNAATAGDHSIEILRAAAAHKVGGATFGSETAALGFSGSFDLTGSGGTATISVISTDTLQDIRDRLSNANTGTNATGVSASIVQVSSSAFVLVLTDDKTGQTMTFANESGGILNSLGISADGGTTLSNQLQAAQTARFTADGLLDPDRYESQLITGSTVQLSVVATGATYPASFDIKVGADTVTVSGNNGTDTVSDLVNSINTAITAAGAGNAVFDAGTAASLMTDGEGVRVVLTNSNGSAITLTDTNGLLAGLGVDNNLVIERTDNTISDLFNGVTLTLFQAEEGTQINLDIEQDLGAIKTGIEDFVTAYNSLRSFINDQTLVDPNTGEKSTDAGVLFGSRTVASVEDQLAQILGNPVQGVSNAFAVLAQIGVAFVDNNSLSDPSLADTLQIDTSKLDTAILTNADDVRKVFAFDFTTSDPRVVLLGFSGQTTFNASGYTLNLNFDDRFQSDQVTTQTVFTQVDAETGGPAADGISAISFDSSVPSSVTSGHAFRYSYNGTTEDMTVLNLTAGTSQTVNLTATLDAAAGTPGANLGAGQSATVSFSSLGVTLTLTGDGATPFTRATDISDGTLDTASLDVNTTMTNGAVTTPTTGMNKLTVDALVAAGAYNQANGLLTLGVTSNAAGEVHFDTAAGMLFTVDGGGPPAADITATDLDDAAAHSIGIYINDGTSDVLVATLALDSIASTAAGSGSLTIDLGTGLAAETSVEHSATAAIDNYRPAVANGSFEIRDSSSTLLGTVNYLETDSVTDLANTISAIAGVTATINSSGGTFQIEIVHDTNDAISLTNDTGGVLTQLNITDTGSTLFAANIGGPSNGTSDGSATVSGNAVTVTSQSGAEGLQLFYGGNVDVGSIQLDFTVGIGTQLFFALESMLDTTTGVLETDISGLEQQNEINQERIDAMLDRLEMRRQTLTDKFIALEVALAKADRIRQSIQQTFDAIFASQK